MHFFPHDYNYPCAIIGPLILVTHVMHYGGLFVRLNKNVAIYGTIAAAAALLIIFLALPPLIKHLAINKIDEATGRKSQIGKVSINPFTLTAAVSGITLSEKGSSAVFLSLSSARLSMSPLSLPKRSFIISELQLTSPYLHVIRNAPNSFNFTDLLQKKPAGEKERKGGTPLFSINNITIQNASVDFYDRALSPEKEHTLREMNISIPFITNMPYLADRYVTPRFSAVVNGSPFRFEGRLKPLTKAVEATISVNVKQFDLPYYLGYLPVPLPVKVHSGKLETALELGYRVDEKRGPDFRLSGVAAVDTLALGDPAGAPLASLKRGELRIKNLGALSRQYDLASLTLTDPEIFASRDRAGTWNWQKLGSNSSAKKEAEQPARAKQRSDLRLGQFTLTGGKLHLTDDVPKGGFRSDLHGIEMNMQNVSTGSAAKAPFDLKFASARGERLAVNGELVAAPLDVKGTVTLEKVPLKDYYPYLSDTLAAPVTGTLGLLAGFLYNGQNGFSVEKGSLKGEGVAAPFGSGDGFALKEAVINGITLNLKQKQAAVESVALKGGRLTLTGEKDGGISAKRLLVQKPVANAKARGAAIKRRPPGKDAGKPFSYRIGKITGSGLDIRYADQRIPEEPVFALNGLNFTVSGITNPKQGPIPFTLQSGYAKGGRIAASGQVTPAPFRFRGKVNLHRIPLRDLDPYINRDTNVFIADGALDTSVTLNLEQGESGLRGAFNGSLGVRSFYCQDMVFEEDLLKWERLQLDRFSGTLSPFTLAVGEVSVTNFYSRVVIEKDGRLNLQQLKKATVDNGTTSSKGASAIQGKSGNAASGASTAVAAAAKSGDVAAVQSHSATTPPPAEQSQPHAIRIDAITLQGGTLEFSDRHLRSPFDTTFFNLGGRVSGLSSQTNRFAEVDLRGNLENHSPLSITGAINPLRGDLYLDLKVAFSDIELSRFTPYSGTFLGYDVDKGKLSLDLNYKVDNKTLSSQNKVFVDQLSFGKAVESDKATKLPVRLAVALLKDNKGEIHLDLPVTGRTDDPKFSVWKVVFQMLGNLCSKAATAPFALLGSMFGGNEDFSAVPFTPGSAQLSQGEQEKLLKLSQALASRPALNLEISGFVDRELDAEGYRNEVLVKKLKGEKFRALVKQGKSSEGQTQENTEILPEDHKLYLKAVYVKEKFPKPRNAFGLLKDLPEAEMKKLIIANTSVGNDELQGLARERAEAVKAFLLSEGKVAPERLFEKNADIFQPSTREGVGGSRVEFGASVK